MRLARAVSRTNSCMPETAYQRIAMNRLPCLLVAALHCSTALAAHVRQVDVAGPAGSVAFGSVVAVLPNGNIVVTDPLRSSNMGAVYLYNPAGTLISTVTGSTAGDYVGLYGVTVLTNGNYVVLSPDWGNGSAASVGAVTLANANTGLSGAVSAANSLVGSTQADAVGSHGIVELTNGNFVISSRVWNNGAATQAGASTWVNGSTGLTGVVSAANSLVGTKTNDHVGISGVTALSNGNYVVASRLWANSATAGVGAVTWANGSTGLSGPVSVA